MTDATQLTVEFTSLIGSPPSGVWCAPGRVNLIGEHTDYNDGFVLPFALQRRALVALAPRTDNNLVIHSVELAETQTWSLEELKPGTANWSSYLAGVVWVLRRSGYDLPGLSIVLTSDVPLGAGLSSSAAIECATITAINDLLELEIAPLDQARLAQAAENDFVGAPTGLLDQAASILCEPGHGLFLDCRNQSYQQVPLPISDDGLVVLVLDTKTPHSHVDGEYRARRESCERASSLLGLAALRDVTDLTATLPRLPDQVTRRRVRHVVTENDRTQAAVQVAEHHDWAQLGQLLDESHVSMALDYEITVPSLDLAVSVAKDCGALGARMTGGGFGGCIIALCPEGEAEQIGQQIAQAFAAANLPHPEWFSALPAAGARRVK